MMAGSSVRMRPGAAPSAPASAAAKDLDGSSRAGGASRGARSPMLRQRRSKSAASATSASTGAGSMSRSPTAPSPGNAGSVRVARSRSRSSGDSVSPPRMPGRPTLSSTSLPCSATPVVTRAALPPCASRRIWTTTRSPSSSLRPRGRTSLRGRKAGRSPPMSTSIAPSAGTSRRTRPRWMLAASLRSPRSTKSSTGMPSSSSAARHSPGPAMISSSRSNVADSRGRRAAEPSRRAAIRPRSNRSR